MYNLFEREERRCFVKQQNSRHKSERTGSKLSRKGRMSRVGRWKEKKRVDHRFAKAEVYCKG